MNKTVGINHTCIYMTLFHEKWYNPNCSTSCGQKNAHLQQICPKFTIDDKQHAYKTHLAKCRTKRKQKGRGKKDKTKVAILLNVIQKNVFNLTLL